MINKLLKYIFAKAGYIICTIEVQCPLLPSRHEGKDTRSHAVQRTSDDIPPPYGSVALYTDKITTSYHQHNSPFGLNECVRTVHHYRINLG